MAAAAQLKVSATLPTGEVKKLSFNSKATVEQVKNKFFDSVPPRFRKEPWYIVIGNNCFDLEFYRFTEAHHEVQDALESGQELNITFSTQLDAKRKAAKGELHMVDPKAKSVGKEFVTQQKIKEELGVVLSPEEAAALSKQKEEEAARKKHEEEEKKVREAAEAAEKKRREEEEKRQEEIRKAEEAKKKAEEDAKAEAAAGGFAETLHRIEELKKKAAEEEEADNKAIAERLATLNKEFDEKIAAIDTADKKDEDEFNTKLAELQKVGA
jgi:membrane protein involved in colicin uptake